jgi:hypothetical protein
MKSIRVIDLYFFNLITQFVDWNSVFDIATSYRLDGLVIETWLGRDSAFFQTSPTAYLSSCTMGLFPGDKANMTCRWPPTSIWLRGWGKSIVIALLRLWIFMAFSRVKFTFNFNLITLFPVCTFVAKHKPYELTSINRRATKQFFLCLFAYLL